MARDSYIQIKASQDEKERLMSEAAKLGISLSAYMRMCALGGVDVSAARAGQHIVELEGGEMSKIVTLELFTFQEAVPENGHEVLLVEWGNQWHQALFRFDVHGNGVFDLEDDDGTMILVSEEGSGSAYLWGYLPTIVELEGGK